MLPDYKREFLELALDMGVMKFGAFELKSGRISPYFFNSGLLCTGNALSKLGGFYADALKASGLGCDVLFGPAYKGIPLVAATAVAMAERHGSDIPYAYNRKEAKDHGEGGVLVGADVRGDVVIVDDVITAGTAIRETMDLLGNSNAKVVGALIAIDRQERGEGELSAIQEVERDYGIRVISVLSLQDVIELLAEQGGNDKVLGEMLAYRERYGV